MNPLTLMALPGAQVVAPKPLHYLSCDLCASMDTCRPFLALLAEAVTGLAPPATVTASAPELSAFNAVAAACLGQSDSIAITTLRYQSEVVCGSGDADGRQIDSDGYTIGAVDLRSLTQVRPSVHAPLLHRYPVRHSSGCAE